jgi:hypothetical protein
LIASRISAGLPPWGAAMAATRSIRRRIVFGGLPTGGYNRAAPAMGTSENSAIPANIPVMPRRERKGA